MTTEAFVLLLALLVAHELGDFTPLATERIRRAKADGWPVGPIAAHAAIHAVLVGLAVWIVVGPSMSILALAVCLELLTHFSIDLTRARLSIRIPVLSDVRSNPFWWALGVDQLLHGMVLVGIAYLVLG